MRRGNPRERRPWRWPLAFVLLSCLLVIPSCTSGREKSEGAWSEVRESLSRGEILTIEIRGPGRKEIVRSPAEVSTIIDAFVSGAFDEDNPNHFGPTPEITVLFMMNGGEYQAVGQWPDGRFELQRDERQFLVEAPELAVVLKERGFVYE